MLHWRKSFKPAALELGDGVGGGLERGTRKRDLYLASACDGVLGLLQITQMGNGPHHVGLVSVRVGMPRHLRESAAAHVAPNRSQYI
jgi:hypothetical protein